MTIHPTRGAGLSISPRMDSLGLSKLIQPFLASHSGFGWINETWIGHQSTGYKLEDNPGSKDLDYPECLLGLARYPPVHVEKTAVLT